MVKRKMLVFCLVILSIGSGCGVSKSGTAGKQTGGVCASVPFVSEEPVISWTKFGMGKKHSDSLPQKFSSYLMDQNQLDSFFAYVRKPGFRASFSVPFPEPLGCQYFEVTNANTMAPGLVEKYPQFVSLKGTGLHNRSGEARIDFDGKEMKAEFNWDNNIYILKPIQNTDGVVYILYLKKDSNDQKDLFEKNADPGRFAPAAPLPVR